MATAAASKKSEPFPKPKQILLEALRAADSSKGVSVLAVKKIIMVAFPQVPETRVKAGLKKAIEEALQEGTIMRVRGQKDAGASLQGSFRLSSKAVQKAAAASNGKAGARVDEKEVPKYTVTKSVTAKPGGSKGKDVAPKKATKSAAPVKQKVVLDDSMSDSDDTDTERAMELAGALAGILQSQSGNKLSRSPRSPTSSSNKAAAGVRRPLKENKSPSLTSKPPAKSSKSAQSGGSGSAGQAVKKGVGKAKDKSGAVKVKAGPAKKPSAKNAV